MLPEEPLRWQRLAGALAQTSPVERSQTLSHLCGQNACLLYWAEKLSSIHGTIELMLTRYLSGLSVGGDVGR